MLRHPFPTAPLLAVSVLATSLLLPIVPAYCQSPGLAGQDRLGAAPFGSSQSGIPEAPAHAPRSAQAALSPSAQPWPRLEVGAVLCRSEDDLRRRAAAFENPATAAAPTYCRLVARPTPITIVDRAGPGATEVKVTGPDGETGWTDAFLPAKAPR